MTLRFDEKLAKRLGVKKITGLDKFSLFTGVIGLLADTIAIGTFVHSIGSFFPGVTVAESSRPPEGGLLLTALIGLYSLTLLIWFLIRFERGRRLPNYKDDVRAFDLALGDSHDLALGDLGGIFGPPPWVFTLIPVIGIAVLAWIEETRTIFFVASFLAFLPVTLWIYTLTSNLWLALGIGLLASAFLSQYSTFFALILDKFFY